MNDDSTLLRIAARLVESGDFSISSWEQVISNIRSPELLNLVTAARTALEYGTKNKCIKGLPKKSWENVLVKMKVLGNPENVETFKAAEDFVLKVENHIKNNGIKFG